MLRSFSCIEMILASYCCGNHTYRLFFLFKELSDSEIPDCYKCSVCLSLLHEPLKTPCQHVFCALCIRQLNHVSRGRPKCPLCREPIRDVEAEEGISMLLVCYVMSTSILGVDQKKC